MSGSKIFVKDEVLGMSILSRLWKFYGHKNQFDVLRKDWQEFDEYVKILRLADPGTMLDVLLNNDFGTNEAGEPNAVTVRLKEIGVRRLLERKQLQEQPRQVHRQATIKIGDSKIDLRNRANYDLVTADITMVAAVAESYLTQLRNRPDIRTRKRLKCELLRVMMLRGKELQRELYGTVCLWTGSRLPRDFWHMGPDLPPEMWDRPDPPPLRGLDLLMLLRKLVPEDSVTRLLKKHASYGNPENEVADLLAIQTLNPPPITAEQEASYQRNRCIQPGHWMYKPKVIQP
jgi:hypothetical protein